MSELDDNSKTIEEWLHHQLYCRGLFHDEVETILRKLKAQDKEHDGEFWGRHKGTYSEPMRAILRVAASRLVVEYADELGKQDPPVTPWWRPMFEDLVDLEHKQGRPP